MRRARTLLLLLVTLLAVSSSLASRPRPDSNPAPPSPLSQLKRAVGERLGEKLRSAVNGVKNVAAGKAPDDTPPAAAAEGAKEAKGGERKRDIPDDGAHLQRRVLVEGPLSPWIQPTTFLRVALLIIRNAALDNPAAGFLQSILTTELAYTAFTNVFASFAAGVVQDFSQGISNAGAVASEWVVDGSTTLDNTLASEFVYGGAWGFEQFYGFGFEISGDAAAALQQSLQPTWIPKEEEAEGKAAEEYGDEAYDAEGPAGANPGDVDEVEEEPTEVDEAAAGAETDNARRRLLQQRQQQQRKQHKQKPNQQQQQKQQGEQQHKKQKRTPPRVPAMGQRRLLSDQEARQRNLPKGAQLIAQVRKPLPKEQTRLQVAEALRRGKQRKRRKLLQDLGAEGGDCNIEGGCEFSPAEGEFTVTVLPEQVEEVTGEDIGVITSNWFDSFPAALPTSIRDRLLAQLEEFVLDPQVSIALEIAIAFVGVVEPGVGVVSAEAADETTITYDITFHGYDAAVDVAADIERAQGVAGSASAGIAVSEAIIDAAEIINAVTDIVDEVNSQVTDYLAEDEALRMAADAEAEAALEEGAYEVEGAIEEGTVAAQSGPSAASAVKKPPKIIAAHNKAEPFRNLAGATRTTAKAKIPDRAQATAPLRVSAQGGLGMKRTSASNYTGAPGPGMAPGEGRVPGDYPYGDEKEYDYFGPTDYDYEPFGAISGTYAVAVSLIFLEQISLNGGSITII